MSERACTVCGATMAEGGLRDGRCSSCAAEAELLSGPHPSVTTHRQRTPDPGRILRTGAPPATPSQNASTMPRLMTADIAAAAGSTDAPEPHLPPDETFTLADSPGRAATQEAWSLGESSYDHDEAQPRPARRGSTTPKVLVAAALLFAALGVTLLIVLRSPAPDAAHEQRGESGSGAPPAPPAPPSIPSEQRPAPSDGAKRSAKPRPEAAASEPSTAPAPAADRTGATPAPTAPPDFDDRMREGRAALDKGNLQAARAAFEAATQLKPRSAEAVTGLARTLAASEDAEGAMRNFEKAVVLGPDYLPAWSGLAYLRSVAGNRDGAIDAYRRVIAIRPNSREAETARGALVDLGVTEP